jgi:hypothetical protein
MKQANRNPKSKNPDFSTSTHVQNEKLVQDFVLKRGYL